MRHRKIKRPMVPALVFTVVGVLIGLMHAPLPLVLLLAAALGGIGLLPMLLWRNEFNKRNKYNDFYFCTMLTLPHITSEYEKLVFPLKLSVGETVNSAG